MNSFKRLKKVWGICLCKDEDVSSRFRKKWVEEESASEIFLKRKKCRWELLRFRNDVIYLYDHILRRGKLESRWDASENFSFSEKKDSNDSSNLVELSLARYSTNSLQNFCERSSNINVTLLWRRACENCSKWNHEIRTEIRKEFVFLCGFEIWKSKRNFSVGDDIKSKPKKIGEKYTFWCFEHSVLFLLCSRHTKIKHLREREGVWIRILKSKRLFFSVGDDIKSKPKNFVERKKV